MREALGEGGTSFDALYVNVNGASGYFDRSLAAYGQAGEPVPPVRHADPARALHEPLVVLLPALPAPAACGQGIGRSLSRTVCRCAPGEVGERLPHRLGEEVRAARLGWMRSGCSWPLVPASAASHSATRRSASP